MSFNSYSVVIHCEIMLTGEKIKLRALEPTDLDVLYQWENDTTIWLVSGTITPFSKLVLKQYIVDTHQDIYTAKQLRLMIELLQEKKPIGCIDLFDFDPKNKRAGIGILIGDTKARNNGYASEALTLLIQYAFTVLDLHQLYANILIENEQSAQLFKKHSFQKIGIKKDWILSDGKWLDECTLQLINEKR